jgi:hypothetical protein
MGGGASVHSTGNYLNSEWKLWPTPNPEITKNTMDRALPPLSDPEHLQLLHTLREPLGQMTLGQYARTIDKMDLLMCWIDIEEFKQQTLEELRRDCAVLIFKKYILKNIFTDELHTDLDAIPSLEQPTSALFDVKNLADAMAFINAGIDKHSFAPVTLISLLQLSYMQFEFD